MSGGGPLVCAMGTFVIRVCSNFDISSGRRYGLNEECVVNDFEGQMTRFADLLDQAWSEPCPVGLIDELVASLGKLVRDLHEDPRWVRPLIVLLIENFPSVSVEAQGRIVQQLESMGNELSSELLYWLQS